MKIGGAFEHLLELGDRPVEELWLDFEETTNEITEKVVGFRHRKQVVNLPSVLTGVCEERRKACTEMHVTYRDKNRPVKKAMKSRKPPGPDRITAEALTALREDG